MTPTRKRANHIKWLKFAILLSQTNFDALTRGQRLDLKNEFRMFLRSVPSYSPWSAAEGLKLSYYTGPVPEGAAVIPSTSSDPMGWVPADIAEMTKEMEGFEELDETAAKDILTHALTVLTDPPDDFELSFVAKTPVTFTVRDIGHCFDFVVWPLRPDCQILATFAYHLAGSGVTPSMLINCPQCKKLFLASRKPRADRKFHCGPTCSANSASKAYRGRQKRIARAKRLIAGGTSVKEASRLTALDPKCFLAGKRGKKTTRLRRPPLSE